MRKCVGVTDADSRGNLRWALVDSQLMEAGGQNAGSLPSLLRPRLCRPPRGHLSAQPRGHRHAGASRSGGGTENRSRHVTFLPSGTGGDGFVPRQPRVSCGSGGRLSKPSHLLAVPTATARPRDGLQPRTLSPALS